MHYETARAPYGRRAAKGRSPHFSVLTAASGVMLVGTVALWGSPCHSEALVGRVVAQCEDAACYLGMPNPQGDVVPSCALSAHGLRLTLLRVPDGTPITDHVLPGEWRVEDGGPRLEWSPDGSHLAVVSREGRTSILSYSAHSGLVTEVAKAEPPAGTVTDVEWSPSGELLAISWLVLPSVQADVRGGVRILSSSGIEVAAGEMTQGGFSGLSWHPSGQRVATTLIRFEQDDLRMEPMLLEVESGTSRVLLESEASQLFGPVFSPDGEAVALMSLDTASGRVQLAFARSGGMRIERTAGAFRAEGLDLLGLVFRGPSSHGPYWSPDSSCVAMASEEGAWFYSLPTDAESEFGHVLASVAALRLGSWSPDGSAFAWAGLHSLYVRSSSTATCVLAASSVSWSSKGTLFALDESRSNGETARLLEFSELTSVTD